MFFFLLVEKSIVFSCIYSAFVATSMPKAQNAVNYSVLALGTHQKTATTPKSAHDLQKASCNLSPPQTRKKVKTAPAWRIWGGVGGRGLPLVAKAKLQLPQSTASPDFRADAHRRLRRITWPSISLQGGLKSYWMRTCFRNIFLMFFWTYSWNHGIGTLLEIGGYF